MTDLPSLSGAFASAKAALEIAKLIHDSGSSLEKAELKYKLAELFSTLADMKMQLATIQEDVAARDARIAELEQAFESKGTILLVNDAYYRVGNDGKPHGGPLCLRCWEVDRKQRPLVRSHMRGRDNVCPVCKTAYNDATTGHIN